MILEGFEIDHWSCIQHLAVHDLPATGVVVLHGPNGTGKSSIIAALRACLMDYSAQATAKELKRWFPKTGDHKPRVSVTFRADHSSWRITKHFGTKTSKLEKRTTGGAWVAEASTATDAHDQMRALLGGKDSDEGLHQLLWLTQAEFHLPDAKTFDADVQSQLRSVLGVMQTPLDDRFFQQVEQQWLCWFNVKGKRKKESNLDRNLAILAQKQTELDTLNAEFQSMEKLLQRFGDLEIVARDSRRQLEDAMRTRNALQAEYEQSIKRIEAYHLATQRIEAAEKNLAEALGWRQRRTDVEESLRVHTQNVVSAQQDAEEKRRRLEAAEQQLSQSRIQAQALHEARRGLQAKLDAVNTRQQALAYHTQLQAAREHLTRAERLHADLEQLKEQARGNLAPDSRTVKQLEENRANAARLRIELDAAALALTLLPEDGAAPIQLTIDGTSAPASSRYAIRRRAEITIPGWGQMQVTRGADDRAIDVSERDLTELDRTYAAAVAPFGIAASDPDGLDRLRKLDADQKAREPEMKRNADELTRLAPQGLDPLRQQVARMEKLVTASAFDAKLPADADALGDVANELKRDLDANDKTLRDIEKEIADIDQQINGVSDKANLKVVKSKGSTLTLRQQEAHAKETQITLQASIEILHSDLKRMLTTDQIEQQIAHAKNALSAAKSELDAARLNANEETIKDRLASSKDTVAAFETQLKEVEKEYHNIAGILSRTEGLHARRASAAALVEEMKRQTEREALACDAIDRLRTLFEECRVKQLGAVLEPIHDRVLRWMKLLRISGYQSMRFNENFLPESLVAHHGAAEFAFCEESTGTIEQMALMVRLALGATLSKPNDPVVTVLDDPLTHSDAIRLSQMRAVLRSAAAGDAGTTPPAGPLQILVFTCHPEWFRMDDARVIDLAQPEVLVRSA